MDVFSQKIQCANNPVKEFRKYEVIKNGIRYIDLAICWEQFGCTRKDLRRKISRFITTNPHLFASKEDSFYLYDIPNRSVSGAKDPPKAMRFDSFLIAMIAAPCFNNDDGGSQTR